MTAAIATREKVFAAADELFAQGIVVTQERISKELGGGSFSTIGKYLREWKEQTDDDIQIISSPIPDCLKKIYEEMNQTHWDTFRNRYELITDNERIAELEKEVETLRDKLEIAKQDSIRLQEVERIRQEEKELNKQLLEQQRRDAVKIEKLENSIEAMEFTKGLNNAN